MRGIHADFRICGGDFQWSSLIWTMINCRRQILHPTDLTLYVAYFFWGGQGVQNQALRVIMLDPRQVPQQNDSIFPTPEARDVRL